eukprot:2282399-Alexandrium_andersonii.AAC.1
MIDCDCDLPSASQCGLSTRSHLPVLATPWSTVIATYGNCRDADGGSQAGAEPGNTQIPVTQCSSSVWWVE